MACPKDSIAFLFVHQENGELVFTSRDIPQFSPIPVVFSDLVVNNHASILQANKEKTLSQTPLMNTYWLPLKTVDKHRTSWNAYICEIFVDSGYHGVVFTNDVAGPVARLDYLASVILYKGAEARKALLLPGNTNSNLKAQVTACKLVEVFEDNFIHFPKHDQWFTSGGKEKFTKQVEFHVQRNVPLQLTLPAFPAKSCNKAKVLSDRPDKGEELAIHSMKILADRIKVIYPPGARFNIVSDGHVFSDLVGVDDASVDNYGDIFRKMANTLYPGLITFYRLDDLLFVQKDMLQDIQVDHPVKTVLTETAETARKALMFLFGNTELSLREELRNEPETVSLYSGFKRFMVEDLAQHETCQALPSKASKKKLCSKVGFLMLHRNRAYSTMVQWIFPIQLRVSIHPHPNRGPKYGINLIHRSLAAMQHTSDESLFHTPTPWHNTVLEMKDGKFLLLPSAKILGGSVKLLYYPDGRPSHFKQINA